MAKNFKIETHRDALHKALTDSPASHRFAGVLGRSLASTARSLAPYGIQNGPWPPGYTPGGLKASVSFRVREDSVIELGNGIAPGHEPVPYHAAYVYGHPHTSWEGNNIWIQAIDRWRGQIGNLTKMDFGSYRDIGSWGDDA